MLSVQKFPSNKTDLDFVESIFMLVPHFTNFVHSSSSEPPVSEVVKPSMSEVGKSVEVTPPRKIRVDLQEFKPKAPNPPKGMLHDKPT